MPSCASFRKSVSINGFISTTDADPKPTTIAEVAETALCSERHARTLLRQLTQSGWLSWSAQPGRGHRAILHCLATTSELSAPLMHACLEKGLPKRIATGRR
jgi:MarR-like DNA-binding transcriptional regulator SgrR of sgrS sRNA